MVPGKAVLLQHLEPQTMQAEEEITVGERDDVSKAFDFRKHLSYGSGKFKRLRVRGLG